MKVTFLLPELTGKPTGGGRIVYQYASGLADRGHDVTVIHPRTLFYFGDREGVVAKAIRQVGAIVKTIYLGLSVKPVRVSWMNVDKKVKLLSVPYANERYMPDADVTIATLWRTAEYVAEYPARCGEKYYFIQHHEVWSGPECRVNNTWKFNLKKIVIARWLKKLNEDIGVGDARHVPNPVDQSKFYVSQPIEGRGNYVSMLYSPHKWKGAKEGIEALEIAKRSHPNLKALVFGVFPRPPCMPSWVEYFENPSHEVLRDEIYNRSAIYMCPSWLEGWGLPITEALACGCAVVSADNGGVRDIIEHEETGLIVPAKDAADLASSLVRLLSDEEARKTFAHKGLEAIKMFTLTKSLDLFERAISEK